MVLGGDEHHFQSTEQLRARDGDDAEVEKDAEESGDGNLAYDRRGEDRAADENMYTDVRQPLVFDVDQARLFTGRVRLAVLGQAGHVGDAANRSGTDPRQPEQAADSDENTGDENIEMVASALDDLGRMNAFQF